MVEYASDDVAFALRGTDDRSFLSGSLVSFYPNAVFIFAADVRFVHFDNPAKLLLRLHHGRADFVAVMFMRRLVRAKTHLTLNLKRANPFFAGGHQMHDLEPLAKWFVVFSKIVPGYVRER